MGSNHEVYLPVIHIAFCWSIQYPDVALTFAFFVPTNPVLVHSFATLGILWKFLEINPLGTCVSRRAKLHPLFECSRLAGAVLL